VAQWAKSMLVFCGLKNTRTATFWPGGAKHQLQLRAETRKSPRSQKDMGFNLWKVPKSGKHVILPSKTDPPRGPSPRPNRAFWGPILGLTSLLRDNSRPNQPSGANSGHNQPSGGFVSGLIFQLYGTGFWNSGPEFWDSVEIVGTQDEWNSCTRSWIIERKSPAT